MHNNVIFNNFTIVCFFFKTFILNDNCLTLKTKVFREREKQKIAQISGNTDNHY